MINATFNFAIFPGGVSRLAMRCKDRWAAVRLHILVLALVMTGCGGAGSSSGGGSNPSPQPTNSEFLYAEGFNQIFAFSLNSSTGALNPIAAIPGPDTTQAISSTLAADPTGKFLFVYDTQNAAIDVFSINASTGVLTATGTPVPVPSLGGAGGLTIDGSGKFLYVAGVFGIAAYTVNSSTGSLSAVAGSPFLDSDGHEGLIPYPSGNFIYASNIGAPLATLSGFAIDPTTGAINPVPSSPFSTLVEGSPFATAIHPSGRYLYAALTTTKSIEAWSIDHTTGSLTVIPGSPFAVPNDNVDFISQLAIDPSGKFLYTSAGPVLSIDANTGALTATSDSLATLKVSVENMTFDPSGSFLYVPDLLEIVGANVNSTTGLLTPFGSFPTGGQLPTNSQLIIVKVPN
jgi:6-phosphogluconolactonase (cycloisomerase 2 family)